MNSAIWIFERFAIQREIGGVCTVVDLNINAQDFKMFLDNVTIGTQARDGPEQGDEEAFITTAK